jgi:hypothetical protein
MEQFDTQFKQIDVLPMVKHFMDNLDLFSLFEKYIPTTESSLVDHAESLCVLTANIICENKPLYKVQEWLSRYSDGLAGEPVSTSLYNDDRFARALSALFHANRHSLMTELSCNAIAVHKLMSSIEKLIDGFAERHSVGFAANNNHMSVNAREQTNILTRIEELYLIIIE